MQRRLHELSVAVGSLSYGTQKPKAAALIPIYAFLSEYEINSRNVIIVSYKRVDRMAHEMIDSLSDWGSNTYVVLLRVGGPVWAGSLSESIYFREIDRSCDP